MQMHHHASLPEAMQPALFQHSNQSGTAHSPLCTTAAHGSHRNVAVNQILKPKYGHNNTPYQCLLLSGRYKISFASFLSSEKENVPKQLCVHVHYSQYRSILPLKTLPHCKTQLLTMYFLLLNITGAAQCVFHTGKISNVVKHQFTTVPHTASNCFSIKNAYYSTVLIKMAINIS